MGHVRVKEIKKMLKTRNYTSRGKTVFLHLEISKGHGSALNAVSMILWLFLNVYEMFMIKLWFLNVYLIFMI